MPNNFSDYQGIAQRGNTNISYRVVLDRNNKVSAVGLFGRFVRSIRNVFRSESAVKKLHHKVITDFQESLRIQFREGNNATVGR